MSIVEPAVKSAIGTNLLAWYRANKRDLPWRRMAGDPYAVWVSEIMLQQTTVATVGPYFERWMARFPTIADLAAAPLDDVLKLWAGLGYYARARNLHRAAGQVAAVFGGAVPSDPVALKSLPGIGRYTAGAILSIAYNADEPILDTNVVRVLSRLFAVGGDPKTNASTQKTLWDYAQTLIPAGRASDFNQAMMELGALICEPAAPKCGVCPLQEQCLAHRTGQPAAYPELQRAARWTTMDDVAVALKNSFGHIALAKRSASETLWGGLWELPRATRRDQESLSACAARAVLEGTGLEAKGLRQFGAVNHVVARRKITLYGFIAEPCLRNAGPIGYEEIAWEPPDRASGYAMATPQVRLLAELARFESQGRLFDETGDR